MSQISAFDPTAEALRSTTPNGFSSMKSEDFIRVIFAELANQDPFQPSDSAALLEQLSSIRSIESDLELTDQLNALVLENQLASASNLIGKMVGGLTTTNDRVAGTVVSVIRQGDQVTLELDTGWLMPIESVEQIIDLPPQD
ncbi:MAG: flagellar hook capping FlgD N-terminal domain-containing protein, partial [Planctomycetota bacterium]